MASTSYSPDNLESQVRRQTPRTGQSCVGTHVLIQWDTAGQERFRAITNGYYRGADGIIIVYDLTDRESFEKVNKWYEEMSKNINQNVVCMLIGNKLDMDSRRAVETREGQLLGKRSAIQLTSTGYPSPKRRPKPRKT